MNHFQDKEPAGGGPPATAGIEPPEILDIFRHAWPVVWERPLPTVLYVAALAVIETLGDRAVSALLEPFGPAMAELMSKGPGDPGAVSGMAAAADVHGGGRLAAGLALPLLLMPFVSFAVCRAAISLWDGYAPAASDLTLSLACYMRALAVFAALSVYGLGLGSLTALAVLPFWAFARGTAGGLLLGALALAGAAALWIKLVWPAARRYLFLQFFVYFRISDHPGLGGLFREALALDRTLKAWPSHLNVLCALAFAVILGVFVAASSVAAMAPSLASPEPGLALANAAYLA
ncbi:MAG: hypothetical protein LBG06_10685, partial [Deltaproteobacteria bacterium]|nr:hypothetical protein [Deltaproteobacteria bacterium]